MMKYLSFAALFAGAALARQQNIRTLIQTTLNIAQETDLSADHHWAAGSFTDAEGNLVQFRVDNGSKSDHPGCSVWGYTAPTGKFHGDFVSCPYYNFQKVDLIVPKRSYIKGDIDYTNFGTLDWLYVYNEPQTFDPIALTLE